ncbi:hypothetical protein CspeluHIS016_0200300 [Cutaneotrichosporon spelunceum]|uniref:Scramblase-domain-containing protein n=1 Tax=Cutaneotrichosporon spelunceum TaxID=1672016 RepID=A0AAD3TQN0_9TREE|nr:hypothetical protein CspeluHIS016_0200300 [Cutaneotrichosporon spelunceum]
MLRPGLAALRPALRANLATPLQRTALAGSLPPLTSLSRQLSTSTSLLRRDDDWLPRGSVRPVRRRARRDGTNDYQQSGPQPGPYEQPYYSRPGVVVPNDPKGVLQENHAAYELLAHDSLVVVRQFEMMNIFLGYEQANRYAIYSSDGAHVGFLAEQERGFSGVLKRQILLTHRPFKSTVMDRHGRPILYIERPFAFINSRIRVRANPDLGAVGKGDSPLVGETQQQWHPWRRRYNLFETQIDGDREYMDQFARIDGGLLAWDFWLTDDDGRVLATINKNFTGFGREMFTDTGQYVIRFDAAGNEIQMPPGSKVKVQGQTLVLPDKDTVDIDYFSRHSGRGSGFFPLMMFGGGDGGSEASSGGERTSPGTTGAAAGAAAGAAGGYEGRDWTDDEIYGRSPPPDQQGNPTGPYEPPAPGQQAEGFDYPPGSSGNEEIMQDPWGNPGNDDGGLFGGGDSGGGGGGGGWDFGDWS